MDAGQWRFELGVAEKAARLRGLRLALQGEADSQKWLSHVALRYARTVDRQKRVQGGGVGMEEKKDGKALKTLRLQNYINKLDKNTLNLYTVPRAYG